MQDQNSSQLELFIKPGGYGGEQREKTSFFGYIRGHERVVLVLIALVVTGIVSFSLGVERGKSIAMSAGPMTRFDLAADREAEATVVARTAPAAVIVTPLKQSAKAFAKTPAVEKGGTEAGAYTIQLASYNNKAIAQKEYNALKKKGFSAVIIPRGKYAVLCVGNFSSKEGARALLNEFKKRYKTCYIRRL